MKKKEYDSEATRAGVAMWYNELNPKEKKINNTTIIGVPIFIFLIGVLSIALTVVGIMLIERGILIGGFLFVFSLISPALTILIVKYHKKEKQK